MTVATNAPGTLTLRDEASRFKRVLDERLAAFLTSEQVHFKTITSNPRLARLLEQLKAVASDGKRLRPFLIYKLYTKDDPTKTETDIMDVLLAVELFHIFCLIHDDIMDEAPLRHGVATIHHFATTNIYNDSSNNTNARRTGDNQAILAGDMVFNMVFKLLYQASSNSLNNIAEVRTLFHTLTEEVCLGQMIDIDLTSQAAVTEAGIVEKNRLKTAYYSFVRPLHIGALLSNRADLIPFITSYGEAVGLLYQVQDDLLDVTGDAAITKKEPFQDITQFQHTVLSQHVRTHGGTEAQLLTALAGHSLTPEDKVALRRAFTSSGAIAHAETLIDTYLTDAHNAFDAFALHPPDRDLFTALLFLVYKRTT